MVIGGSNFDIICKVDDSMAPNSSTVSANIRTSFGGVARNLADALARLDCKPYFISAVGPGTQSFTSLMAYHCQIMNRIILYKCMISLHWHEYMNSSCCPPTFEVSYWDTIIDIIKL